MTEEKGGRIRVGIGGWTYEGWRGGFYPESLAHRHELEHASRQVTTIEINSTFYRQQAPGSFAKWHDETPEGFVFAVKAPRFATSHKVLGEAGPAIEHFFMGGVMELKDKLGPINWQFAASKPFEPEDFEAFLHLLPHEFEGIALRHAVEVRHESFRSAEFVDMARGLGIAVVIAGDSDFPQIADVTAPFVYARIMGTAGGEPRGYPDAALDTWAARAKGWAAGTSPEGLSYIGPRSEAGPRDVFLYVIGGNKPANPEAAMGLIKRLG